jgi:glycosyltransferase involved in cell wall biosynthesis
MGFLWGLLMAYAAAALAYWLWTAYAIFRLRRDVPRLADLALPEPLPWPRVSVVAAACDEADKIEPAARSLLAEDYPDLELVFVDDRSTDSTGAIIDRLAAKDKRVKAIHVRELPAGWLGKVHALDRGLRESTGALVLFTDADVHFSRGALRRAVAYAEQQGLGHLAALPELWPASFLADAMMSVFLRQFMMAVRPWAVGDPKSRAFIGIGAFNLVRRSAFDATPGLEWLRLEQGDDVGLGLMMKRSGARCGVVNARGLVALHWYRTVREAAVGGEKGWATGLRFSLWRAFIAAGLLMALELSPLLTLLPLAFDPVRPAGYAGFGVLAACAAAVGRATPWNRRAAILRSLAGPLTAPLLAALTIRAAILGRRRGGILWRGTLYPTQMLRGGMRVKFP